MTGFLMRPLRRRALLGLAATAIVAPVLPTAAAIDPAEAYVRKVADQVMSLANSGQKGNGLKSRFAALLNSHINLRAIANFALGSYQSKLPASRKAAQDPRFKQKAGLGVFLDLMTHPNAGHMVTTPITSDLNEALGEVEREALRNGGHPALLLDEVQAELAPRLMEVLAYQGGR